MGKALDTILPIAGAVLGSIALPGIGTSLGLGLGSAGGAAIGGGLTSAGVNYSQTHNIGSALKAGALGGAGSYVGSNLGGSILGSGAEGAAGSGIAGNLGTIGDALDSAIGTGASSSLSEALGGGARGLFGGGLGSALGGAAGGQIAGSYAPQGQPKMSGQYPFQPTGVGIGTPNSSGSGAMPASLNGMSSLTPQQQATSLATQGSYGGGLGPQERGYFGNLVQNQLNPQGRGTNDLSTLSPIENSYLGQLGFGSYGNSGSPNSLLEALSKWNPSA